jgi:hypothetical protein
LKTADTTAGTMPSSMALRMKPRGEVDAKTFREVTALGPPL